ncbi:MAG TPA: 4Fe-4S dicluster domain-containing protein [Tepidisphaeraceae bacterium]|nr:4Fe-4S dicluster domain-containing protein [Tepidisphaeraceae bacterium]
MSSAPTGTTEPSDGTAGFRELGCGPRLYVPCEGEPRPPGTHVAAGEPLSRDGGSPAPAAGRIVAVSRRPVLGGEIVTSLELETEDSPASPAGSTDAARVQDMLGRLKPADLPAVLEKLQASGVGANRWASPDLLGQLRKAVESPPTFILCGALDLDPALPLQRTLAATRAMEIAAGAAALGKLTGTQRVILSVPEDMSPVGIAALRAASAAARLRLYPIQDEYPVAHPSLLIRRITGRRLKPGRLPIEAGVILLDAPAALALGRRLLHGEPMLRVPFGVYDLVGGKHHLLWAPVGATVEHALHFVGISSTSCELRAGHMLRDVPASRDAILAGGELTLFASEPHPAPDAEACLRCGWCVEACPAGIHPAGLLDAAQQHDPQLAQHHGIQSCIECGICSYVCPSRLPLMQSIRHMRAQK